MQVFYRLDGSAKPLKTRLRTFPLASGRPSYYAVEYEGRMCRVWPSTTEGGADYIRRAGKVIPVRCDLAA